MLSSSVGTERLTKDRTRRPIIGWVIAIPLWSDRGRGMRVGTNGN